MVSALSYLSYTRKVVILKHSLLAFSKQVSNR